MRGRPTKDPHTRPGHHDRRFTRNQSGKRKVVVIVRERDGNSVPAVFNTESQAASFIRARIAKGTVVHADEAGAWDNLHERFEVKRINHQEAYSLDGASKNWAEEYFSRLRRAEIGIHRLEAGKSKLAKLLERRPEGTFVAPYERGEIGPDLFHAACQMNLEGLVSKHLGRQYRPKTCDWVKVKNRHHPAFRRVVDQF
ncbi:transposase [Bradyrhizobium jicamae]|uniref:transposase n=1 Tax=Bradyrhizobium jicamae TaxID=280332 RepID=UPI002011CD1E|nr:transposase [Bradyrhizobium jicamae]